MARPGWRALLGVCLLLIAVFSRAAVVEARQAAFIVDADALPPAATDPRWRATRLPDLHRGTVVWYRIEFERPDARPSEPCALYLPYLYGGGRVWLDGEPIAALQESDERVRVSWERPQLLPIPLSLVRSGRHVMMIRASAAAKGAMTRLSLPLIGPAHELQAVFDRRMFWVRTVPTLTVVVGAGVGPLFLLVWWRRRDELLYGLFGLAALLWAVRTNTFVFDAWPSAWWPSWRLIHHAATGGFVVLMATFASVLAGWYRRWLGALLAAYWVIGPLIFVWGGPDGDERTMHWWWPGLVVIGLAIVALSLLAACRQRRPSTTLLAVAMTFATAAGVHDYLLTQDGLRSLAPHWAEQRIFLLHHGANLLLLVMAALLSSGFVRSLRAVEEMNRTLERRVADREREIEVSYAQIAAMQREQAATDERRRIMQDLHDGLGSRLLISLLQVERDALAPAEVAGALRACIAEMRLAIEALGSDDDDFRTALGDFLFRWEAQLRDAGLASAWHIDPADDALTLAPHAALQMLRVLQEALTNVVKHAAATRVSVRLTCGHGWIRFEVEDDGRGLPASTERVGRGLSNMRTRVERLGGRLEAAGCPGGTCIRFTLPRSCDP